MKKLIKILICFYLVACNRNNHTDVNSSKFNCSNCNVVIISLSNTRLQNMSYYGFEKQTTPKTDLFFRNSFAFKKAITPASLTYTDSISLFYSLHPYTHKLFNRNDTAISSKVLENKKSLPKVLAENGYTTAAFVSDEDYAYEYGLGKEFQKYFDRSQYPDYGIKFRPFRYEIGTKDLVKPTIDWLNQNKNKKFFLFFQAYDLHCPYTPSENFEKKFHTPHNKSINFNNCYMTLDKVKTTVKDNKKYFLLDDWQMFLDKNANAKPTYFEQRDIDYLINLYNAELNEADQNLDQLYQYFTKNNLLKNTIFIFMSEHGDYLGENGYYMKASVKGEGNVHNANLGFPFILKFPEVKKQYFQKQVMSILDIAPSILSFLNIKIPTDYQGVNFNAYLGTDKPFNEFVFSGAHRKRNYIDKGVFTSEALQDESFKLNHFETRNFESKNIIEEKFQLFNMKIDPNELNDIANSEIQTLDQYKIKLKKAQQKYYH